MLNCTGFFVNNANLSLSITQAIIDSKKEFIVIGSDSFQIMLKHLE